MLVCALVGPLRRVLRGSVIALKGDCPRCTEEVYTFINDVDGLPQHDSSTSTSELAGIANSVKKKGSGAPILRQTAECHVCGSGLLFELKLINGGSRTGGRIYQQSRADELVPPEERGSPR